MSSKAHAERLSRALELSGLVQPVNSAFSENRINVLCRIAQGSEGKWTELVRKILLATDAEQGEAHSWQAHICRHYFLKEAKGEKKLVFGWNVSIQSQDMSGSLDVIMRVVKGEPVRNRPPGELEEMEMTGLTKDRNIPKFPGDKGAFSLTGPGAFKPTGAGR
jgi:predicted transcriptional regulator